MGQIIAEFITLLGGFGIVVAAIAWLSKQLIDHYLLKEVQQHKASLDAQNQAAAERLRAELQQQLIEHEITFRRIDEKVAERLEKSYQLLLKLYIGVSKLVAFLEMSSDPSKDDRLKECDEANRAFKEYFYDNRCHIPPALYRHIKKVADNLVDIANGFAFGLKRERLEQSGRRPLNHRRDSDYWGEAFDAVEKDITPLFSAMVEAFQMRLGVKDSPAELSVLAKLPEPAKLPPHPPNDDSGSGDAEEDLEAKCENEELENAIHRPIATDGKSQNRETDKKS